MAKQWLLKVTAQDDENYPVLLRVISKGNEGLDLDLVATESTAVFKGKLRKRKVQALAAKNYSGTEDEWEAILKYVLLEGQSSVISEAQKQSLEVGASVKGKEGQKVLSITFCNRIDDITQRIGAIELSENDAQEISLFDWAILAVDKHKSVAKELSTISKQAAEYKTTIASLQKQLADFIEAKAEHEEQLISKFVLLLNEKKARIRDLLRVIQTAQVDKDRVQEMRGSIDARRASYTTSRATKRPAPDDDDSEDESQAFETQDDTRRQESEDEQINSGRQTVPVTTESEASDDDELPIRAKEINPRKSSPQKVKSAPTTASVPPHASPFGGKSGQNISSETPKAPQPPLDDDDETASEDDEL